MCFDLMQEEIIAKFRWIGTKLGIVDKPEDLVESTDKDKRTSSSNEIYPPPSATTRTILDNENLRDTPTMRNSRKTSPRSNIARVHPTGTNGNNEATLHQRMSIKSY